MRKVLLDRSIPILLIPPVSFCFFYMLGGTKMSQPQGLKCPMGQQLERIL